MNKIIPFTGDSLIDLIRFRAREQPEQVAYIHLKEKRNEIAEITYSEFSHRVFKLATRLQRFDVDRERLVLMYPSGINYLIAYFATICAGGIAVPVYESRQSYHHKRLEGIVGDSQPKLLLTDLATVERSNQESIDALSRFGARWLYTDSPEADEGIEVEDWNPVSLGRDDIVFLQYTSGSTGDPKGVVVSNGNLMHNSAMINRAIKPHAGTLNVSWLPSYHDMGLIGGLLQPLYAGFPCVFMSPITAIQRPIRLLEAIYKYQATICGGPNFIYEACINRIRDKQLEGIDLSRWEIAFNGAEPINADTLARFTERFAPYGFRAEAHFPCYGMAETTLYVSAARTFEGPVVRSYEKAGLKQGCVKPMMGDGVRRLVSSGRVFEDELTVKIVDPDTCLLCPDRTVGEIWIRGASVASGYWRRKSTPGEDFFGLLEGDGKNRYLRTGDLGFVDGKELFITGRLKDVIIVHGKNHYPQDIEYSVANAHEEIKPDSGAAFSVPLDGTERLVVLQELNIRIPDEKREKISEDIHAAVAAQHEMQLSDLRFIRPGTLPKTTSGKIQRHMAKRMYLEELKSSSI